MFTSCYQWTAALSFAEDSPKEGKESYCKNLKPLSIQPHVWWLAPRLIQDRHVIQVRGVRRQIRRRIDPGKCAEIVDEMRLVVVPAIERDPRPINGAAALNRLQHFLKAPNPAEKLWRQPDFFFEHVNKPPRTKSRAIRHCRDGPSFGRGVKFAEGIGHCGMPFESVPQFDQPRALQDAQFLQIAGRIRTASRSGLCPRRISR